MPEPTLLAAAPAGIGMALAVLGATRPARDPAARWLGRRRAQPAPAGRPGTIRFRALPLGMFRPWLEAGLDQAGWRETPERFLAGVCLATIGASLTAAGLGALGGASGAGPAALAAVAVPTVAGLLLRRAQDRRREALVAELCPILELVSLELHAGGSSRSSLAAVLSQLRGDLAGELRRILISSQMTGSEPVESRLAVLAERLGLPPVAALAAILAASRVYGTSVGPGIRALAADLRRRQRRRLIAVSRRALNRVLVPAAVGVLLPFMGILLFPAVATLLRSLG